MALLHIATIFNIRVHAVTSVFVDCVDLSYIEVVNNEATVNLNDIQAVLDIRCNRF